MAPILQQAPEWNKVLHVHIDASTFVIGCVLAQHGNKNMDFSALYASRQLNVAKKELYYHKNGRTIYDICYEEILALSTSQSVFVLCRSPSAIIHCEQTLFDRMHCAMVCNFP